MIFIRHGVRWKVDERGFLHVDATLDGEVGETWIRYGWLYLI